LHAPFLEEGERVIALSYSAVYLWLIIGDYRKSDKKEPYQTSNETSDFIVDGLELWWEENKERHSHIKELVINPDNGPHINSHRTQFIKRMIEFADKTGLKIRLVYYPPVPHQI